MFPLFFFFSFPAPSQKQGYLIHTEGRFLLFSACFTGNSTVMVKSRTQWAQDPFPGTPISGMKIKSCWTVCDRFQLPLEFWLEMGLDSLCKGLSTSMGNKWMERMVQEEEWSKSCKAGKRKSGKSWSTHFRKHPVKALIEVRTRPWSRLKEARAGKC